VLATALRDAGHEVAEFADAEVAQTALRRAAPQLLVCDVRLPGANGLVLLRDIKAARERLSAGTYGICTDCGEPITYERLLAYPTAKRCIHCQRLREQEIAASRLVRAS